MTVEMAATTDRQQPWRLIAFWIAIAAGTLLRFVSLGHVPGGLNSDEASSGVEALSILRTGADIWGNHMPVWFPAWGSGMNALFTYLAVPVVWLFGLNVFTLRALAAAFGVLTLPIAYQAARIHFGRDAALITMVLLAVLPWHVMSSRWALDSNLAPLFFTLGLYTIGKALKVGARWPVAAFIPWAISIYAYPAVLYAVIPSGVAILYAVRKQIMLNATMWLIGLALCLVIDLPLFLFLLKNYALHTQRLPFEGVLPFSIPLLAATRLSQINQPLAATLFNNLTFIFGGYRDDAIWHQSRFFLPLTGAAPYLTLAGAVAIGWRWFETKRPNLVLIVAATIIIPICAIPLQLTRLNWFYVPSLMIAAKFLVDLPSPFARRLLAASALYLTIFSALFYSYYFTSYNQEAAALDRNLGNGFRLGLEGSLRDEVALAKPEEPIFVNIGTIQPYLYVLYYGLATVESFQKTRRVATVDGVYQVSGFDSFFFDKVALPRQKSFVFVSQSNDLPCATPDSLKIGPLWASGRCPASD